MNSRGVFTLQKNITIAKVRSLPTGIHSTPYTDTTTFYKTTFNKGIASQMYYELQIDHNCLFNFSSATELEKKIRLKIAYFDTAENTKPAISGEFLYTIYQTKLINKANNIWKVKTKLDKKITGDYTFPKEFPEDLTLVGKQFSHYNIVNRQNQPLVTIPYPANIGTGEGCFLTTACVEHKQLADDCYELTMLRSLREDYMKNNNEGLALISEYKIIGPKIVQAINGFTNKAAIYDYMYDNMIIPSVELVKAKKFAAATEYYKKFTAELMKQYL